MNTLTTRPLTTTPRAEISQIRADLADLSIDDLRSVLAEQIATTAAHVARMAAIWTELEARGEDMSTLRSGIGRYLPAVAAGRLLPEAIVRFAGNTVTLRALSSLTTDNQRAALERGALSVVRSADAEPESVPLLLLTSSDVSRAVDAVRGEVVEPARQRMPKLRSRPRNALTRRVVLLLTDSEHTALLAAAERSKRSASDLVRQVLVNGVLKGR